MKTILEIADSIGRCRSGVLKTAKRLGILLIKVPRTTEQGTVRPMVATDKAGETILRTYYAAPTVPRT